MEVSIAEILFYNWVEIRISSIKKIIDVYYFYEALCINKFYIRFRLCFSEKMKSSVNKIKTNCIDKNEYIQWIRFRIVRLFNVEIIPSRGFAWAKIKGKIFVSRQSRSFWFSMPSANTNTLQYHILWGVEGKSVRFYFKILSPHRANSLRIHPRKIFNRQYILLIALTFLLALCFYFFNFNCSRFK